MLMMMMMRRNCSPSPKMQGRRSSQPLNLKRRRGVQKGKGVHFMEGEGDKQQERARNRTETYFVIAAVVFFNQRGRAWMSRRIIHVTCAQICRYASFLLVTAPELEPT